MKFNDTPSREVESANCGQSGHADYHHTKCSGTVTLIAGLTKDCRCYCHHRDVCRPNHEECTGFFPELSASGHRVKCFCFCHEVGMRRG